jgi:thiol-disulfide isomerase/thioredoxin
MTIRNLVCGLVCVGILVAAPAMALKLGDPAPPINVDKWVKGGPVDLAAVKGKNVVVVEFWATWCGPCKASIPHLSKLQKEHKADGLLVVSISSADENEEVVTKYVKSMGDRMDFVVAYENKKSAKTDKAYLEPFKIDGIPAAFVIDKQGNLVWQGHPMFGLDAVVAATLKGDHSVESLKKIGDAAAKEIQERYRKMMELKDEYFELVAKPKQVDAAREKGEALLKAASDEAQMLNEVAWTILTDEDVQSRDLDLALRVAKKANELSGGEDSSILDTYARALFDNGKVDEAIEIQKKAIELTKDNKAMRKELEAALKKYEAARKK